jgi:hypothetical protein
MKFKDVQVTEKFSLLKDKLIIAEKMEQIEILDNLPIYEVWNAIDLTSTNRYIGINFLYIEDDEEVELMLKTCFVELLIGEKFTSPDIKDAIFVKTKPFIVEDGEFGFYVYNAKQYVPSIDDWVDCVVNDYLEVELYLD